VHVEVLAPFIRPDHDLVDPVVDGSINRSNAASWGSGAECCVPGDVSKNRMRCGASPGIRSNPEM
jgi:hypothetical protein